MIKIEHIVEPCASQMEFVIESMRNPMNSWDRSDSYITYGGEFILGENDKLLMEHLCKAGTDHRKFMRQMPLMMRITAPLYWWKEYDTYKVGTVANSCSTMHKIHAKEFERTDFSCEHLPKGSDAYSDTWDFKTSCNMVMVNEDDPLYVSAMDILDLTIKGLNHFRDKFIETKDKKYWWQMIQLLPSSYNQTRDVTINYEVAHNIFNARNNHKLDEWREFCDVLKSSRYSFLISEER